MNPRMWAHPGDARERRALARARGRARRAGRRRDGRGRVGRGPDGRAGRDRRPHRAAARAAARSPGGACSSPPAGRASRSTRCASSATAPPAAWASRSRRRRGGAGRRSSCSPRISPCPRRRVSTSSRRRPRRRCSTRRSSGRRSTSRCWRPPSPTTGRPRRSRPSGRRTASPGRSSSSRRPTSRACSASASATARCSSPSAPSIGEDGLERKRRMLDDEERRPRRLQRRLARRHRLRRRRERGRPRRRDGRARSSRRRSKARDRGGDPRRGGAPACGRELSDAYDNFQEGRRRLKDGMPRRRRSRSRRRSARAGEGVDPRGARDRVLPAPRAGRRPRRSSARVLELSPTDDYAHYALGRALEKQGRRAEANGHYKLASSMVPESAPVRGAHPRARRCSAVERGRPARLAGATVTPGGEIGAGLCILLGVAATDDEATAERLAGKIARLRDLRGRRRRSSTARCSTIGGAALVVSQFTLIADSRRQKGTRPDFSKAARPRASPSRSTSASAQALRDLGVPVETGRLRGADGSSSS